jgi:U3 small nucleolar RNA-associated protein 14
MEHSSAPRKLNEVVISKESSATEKSKNKLRKRKQKGTDEKEKAKADAELEISTTDFLTLPSDNAGKTSAQVGARSRGEAASVQDAEGADESNEVNDQEKVLRLKGSASRMAAIEQRDLVALAFAGDDVVQVCLAHHASCNRLITFRDRTSPRPSEERFKRTLPRRWIPHYLAG